MKFGVQSLDFKVWISKFETTLFGTGWAYLGSLLKTSKEDRKENYLLLIVQFGGVSFIGRIMKMHKCRLLVAQFQFWPFNLEEDR